jgi:polysaccharide export outer membrane protein
MIKHHLLPFFLVATASLTGCVFAPGQSVDLPSPLFQSDDDQGAPVRVVPITAKLVALQQGAEVPETLPEALTKFKPSEYHIGVGDQVLVTIWEHPQLTNPGGTQSLEGQGRPVREDGTMFYPYAGNVKAVGLTVEQLRLELTRRLSKYLNAPQLDVTLARTRSQRIGLSGAFTNKTPLDVGVVPISLTEALGRAGIEADTADFSALQISRDTEHYILNLDRLNRSGVALDQVYLQAGDALHMPYSDQKKVYLMGELRTPKAMSFKGAQVSLANAIGDAGSLVQTSAKANAVYVIRNTGPDPELVTQATVFQLDMNDPLALVMSDRFQLRSGDVVYVGAPGIVRWNRFINQLFPSLGLAATGQNLGN